jgi:uncharacterized protein YprB with RNaseH-like and TPR domain
MLRGAREVGGNSFLLSRFWFLGHPGIHHGHGPRSVNLEELRARLGTPAAPAVAPQLGSGVPGMSHPVERCVPGQVLEGPGGECFVVDSVRGRDQHHGRFTFGALTDARELRLPVPGSLLGPIEVDLRSAAFIDTETTGLGSGVGTHVFMIGVGRLEEDTFRVRQFFLRHPGEEAAMLGHLAEYLAEFTSVISFNGRSFDWPLVENRFVFQRLRLLPADPVHVDLLHWARRLWKLRVESCAMGSVERSVLGVRRTHDDVEGWMIPQLYFQYLRTGNARPLRRVFYHNLQDILSLAFLAVHVDRILQDPWSGVVEDPVDFYSLGRVYDRLGDEGMATRCIEGALDQGLPPRIEAEALLRWALIEKRRRNWQGALPLFIRILDRRGFERIACVELAKYHEHVARDHDQAMRFTLRAMRSRDAVDYVRWPGTRRIELHQRHRRLQHRLARRVA